MRAASGSTGSIGALIRPREARRRRTGAESGAEARVEGGICGATKSTCCRGSMTLPTSTSGPSAVRPTAGRTTGPLTALPTSAREGMRGVASDGADSRGAEGDPPADGCAGGRTGAGLAVAARRRGAGRGGSENSTCSSPASSNMIPSSSRVRCISASRELRVEDRRGRRWARAAINPIGPESAPCVSGSFVNAVARWVTRKSVIGCWRRAIAPNVWPRGGSIMKSPRCSPMLPDNAPGSGAPCSVPPRPDALRARLRSRSIAPTCSPSDHDWLKSDTMRAIR